MKEFYINKLNLSEKVENGLLSADYPEVSFIPSSYLKTKGGRFLYSFAYYLLPFPNINPLHQLRGEESWQYCDGAPLLLHTMSEKGRYESYLLGKDMTKGEKFIHVVPRFTWMAAEVMGGEGDFTLISHLSFPAFDLTDHLRGNYEELIRLFPQHHEIIKRFQWR